MAYFSWPTLPFTGTEVETFAAAYRDLAEEIMVDFDNKVQNGLHIRTDGQGSLKVPYRTANNLKEFLYNGYMYACFVIKQRAGNSGPGTDFILGSSPYGSHHDESAQHWKDNMINKWIIRNLGCIMTSDAMASCYAENRENDPTLPEDGYLPTKGNGDPLGPDELDPLLDLLKENNHPDCEAAFNAAWTEVSAAVNDGLGYEGNAQTELAYLISLLMSNLLKIVSTWSGTVGALYNAETMESFAMALQFAFMIRYLEGQGGVATCSWINMTMLHPHACRWIRDWYADWMKGWGVYYQLHPETESDGYDDYGNKTRKVVDSTPTDATTRGYWGMSATDKKYTVYTGNGIPMHGIFGTAQVITDGTPLHELTGSNLKALRDDYDFRYGWDIVRTLPNDIPGNSFNDDQIASGENYTSNATSICSAAMKNFPGEGRTLAYDFGYLQRQVVASDHGNGKKEVGEWSEDITGYSKPFGVFLQW